MMKKKEPNNNNKREKKIHIDVYASYINAIRSLNILLRLRPYSLPLLLSSCSSYSSLPIP